MTDSRRDPRRKDRAKKARLLRGRGGAIDAPASRPDAYRNDPQDPKGLISDLPNRR